MRRNGLTQEAVSVKLGMTRQTFITRMNNESFNPEEINTLKTLGFAP